jgi:hypothetical protein
MALATHTHFLYPWNRIILKTNLFPSFLSKIYYYKDRKNSTTALQAKLLNLFHAYKLFLSFLLNNSQCV